MFIRYNQYAPNPALRGTIADPKPHIAEQLVANGIAEYYKFPTLKEHLDAVEKLRVATLPPQADQWAINPSRSDDPSALRFIVMHTSVNGITYYDAPPATAPAHVKQRFADLVATDSQAFVDRSNFLKQQAGHVEPKTPGLASVTDIARALIRGKR